MHPTGMATGVPHFSLSCSRKHVLGTRIAQCLPDRRRGTDQVCLELGLVGGGGLGDGEVQAHVDSADHEEHRKRGHEQQGLRQQEGGHELVADLRGARESTEKPRGLGACA